MTESLELNYEKNFRLVMLQKEIIEKKLENNEHQFVKDLVESLKSKYKNRKNREYVDHLNSILVYLEEKERYEDCVLLKYVIDLYS